MGITEFSLNYRSGLLCFQQLQPRQSQRADRGSRGHHKFLQVVLAPPILGTAQTFIYLPRFRLQLPKIASSSRWGAPAHRCLPWLLVYPPSKRHDRLLVSSSFNSDSLDPLHCAQSQPTALESRGSVHSSLSTPPAFNHSPLSRSSTPH